MPGLPHTVMLVQPFCKKAGKWQEKLTQGFQKFIKILTALHLPSACKVGHVVGADSRTDFPKEFSTQLFAPVWMSVSAAVWLQLPCTHSPSYLEHSPSPALILLPSFPPPFFPSLALFPSHHRISSRPAADECLPPSPTFWSRSLLSRFLPLYRDIFPCHRSREFGLLWSTWRECALFKVLYN